MHGGGIGGGGERPTLNFQLSKVEIEEGRKTSNAERRTLNIEGSECDSCRSTFDVQSSVFS